MPVFVTLDAKDAPRVDRRVIRRRAERMLAHLRVRECELSILFTDDAGIQSLNEKHRRKRKPTDVLAFQMGPVPAPNGSPVLLGDIVVSLETASRQARARRRPVDAEVTHLVAHGLLHLLGYDHRTDEEERTMNDLTARLVRAAKRGDERRRNPTERAQRSRLTSRAR